ncbi:hypothetical protein H6G94_08920 [Nostoc punctiforme FACHB-252]|uniref:Uncharacterized protein n=1 Tax=Nostoc punctiforme FACHB-252 TaxID=1357509 RepID=A0ABR8H833_NOSPU|nr:hypothetical protein [Nostoc punctiforme]MBD2611391.1 hypothetical protein [Nostoc punctiforme FACHB-252]
MYINKSLSNLIEEWKNRVANAHYNQLHRELNSFLRKLENTSIVNSILLEFQIISNSCRLNPKEKCRDAVRGGIVFSIFENQKFVDETERAMYHYNLLKVLQEDDTPLYLNSAVIDGSMQPAERPRLFVMQYIDPLVYYIQDKLDESSTVLYLLEKYKQRCEWFFKEEICKLYEDNQGNAEKHGSQEQVLDKELRKFLFDQGIDYPFSQPLSPSGKADIVSLLNTKDPLVLEVKIFDRDNDYEKKAIINGFKQIVKYANNYNKSIGYLFLYNFDTAEINIVTSNNTNNFPNRIIFNGKIYFIIIVNIHKLNAVSASKIKGKLEKITFFEEELTAEAIS